MEIYENLVHCIFVDGRKEGFDVTGHFPVLASVDSTGKESYVASSLGGKMASTYYYTC